MSGDSAQSFGNGRYVGLCLVLVIAGCGSGAGTEVPANRPSSAEPEPRADNAEIEGEIRTRCIEDPPTPEDAERWRENMAAAYAAPDDAARRRRPVEEIARESDADLVIEIGTRLQDKKNLVGLTAMNPSERNVWFVWTLESAAKNGGFGYFFTSYSGDCTAETLPALRAVELDELADIFERAVAVFEEPPSEDRATRSRQVSAIADATETWAPLEAEFSQHSTYPELARYIRANLADFSNQ